MEEIIFSEIVYECPIFKVEHAKVKLKKGVIVDRWYVVKNDAVGIVAVNEKGQVLLTREFRSASQDYSWRIPAGGLNDNENPINGARRELREETGLDAKNIKLIFSKKNQSAWIKQSTHFFVATNLFKSPLKNDDVDIKTVFTESGKVKEMIKKGELNSDIAEAIESVL